MLRRLVSVRNRALTLCVLAAAAVMGTAGAARADNIVTPGSIFGVRLYENGIFAPAAPALMPFDGLTHTITGFTGLNNVDVTPTQTDLGGGVFKIHIVIHSVADLFPAGIGDPTQNQAFMYVGSGNNPLQLTQPFIVTSAFLQGTGDFNFPLYHEFLPDMTNTNPWNGYFLDQGTLAGFVGVVGLGVHTYDLTIVGAAPLAVPLPPAFAGGIVLLGAMGLAKWRGRRG